MAAPETRYELASTNSSDPVVPNWAALELPAAWPDSINWRSFSDVAGFIKAIFSKRQRVQVPSDLPGFDRIPKYCLQEFHNLPNGNYSKNLTRGYITGFDISMLGTMEHYRERMAQYFAGKDSVLDAGCAGGKTAAAMQNVGVKDVWGIDPSPYLLQIAAQNHPDIHFIQRTAEDTGFTAERFDGIAACFLFHELPPKYASQALHEFHRILRPDGLLAITEPSPLQYSLHNPLRLIQHGGFKALYFKLLAHFVHEPFLIPWHKTDIQSWLEQHGFELISDDTGIPVREIRAKKRALSGS